MIFAVLLLYATTGDFMATSMLFVNGHDCDHPWVRIEHKCVTKSADRTKEKKQIAVHRPDPVAGPAGLAHAPQPEPSFQEFAIDARTGGLTGIPLDAVPLRC
jgi:hypothetical protein